MLEIVIALAPLFLLLGALLFGHYPGLGVIVKLSERVHARALARGAKRDPRPVLPDAEAPSGGLLIALGVATRPPPLAAQPTQ